MSKPDVEMLKVLAVLFVGMLIITLAINLWDPWGGRFFVRWFGIKVKQEVSPERAAIKRLRRLSIFYGMVILYLILFQLPTGVHDIPPDRFNSVAGMLELQKNLTAYLEKLRDFIFWALLITAYWFWAVYGALESVFGKVKETHSKSASKDVSPN